VKPDSLNTREKEFAEGGEPPGRKYGRLPEKPLVTIQPGDSWASLRIRDIWLYRELFYFLTWRDVKIRYKQTLLGAAWAILQPMLSMIVFTLLFGRLAGIKSDGIPYPIFAYAGLLVWTFFANALTNSGNSLIGSANLIAKVYFPRIIVPGAAVGAGLVDFAFACAIQILLIIYYRIPVTAMILMVPVLLLLTTLLALGVGMWLSALNVRYRDVRYAIPFLIQLWMFASPVIYPESMFTGRLRILLMFNPLTGIIENFRIALFAHKSFNLTSLGISVAFTFIVLFYSAYVFRRMEREFADII